MPTAASGICDCPVCTSGVAKSYIFTLSGIQDGTCNQCDEQVNGTWEVHTVPTVGPCTRHGEFLPSGPCGTSKFLNWELSFTKSPDPTPPEKTRADLLSPGPFPVLYRLDKEDLDCISALPLTKVAAPGDCIDWPGTITLSPAGPSLSTIGDWDCVLRECPGLDLTQ